MPTISSMLRVGAHVAARRAGARHAEKKPSAAGARQHLCPQPEAQRRLQLQVRKQHAALGRDRARRAPSSDARARRRPARRSERCWRLRKSISAGRPRAERAAPSRARRRASRGAGEQPIGELPERAGVARLADGEAADEHAADAIRALGVLVLPGPRIAGAGRQHVDVVPLADLLGEQAAGVLGARRRYRRRSAA